MRNGRSSHAEWTQLPCRGARSHAGCTCARAGCTDAHSGCTGAPFGCTHDQPSCTGACAGCTPAPVGCTPGPVGCAARRRRARGSATDCAPTRRNAPRPFARAASPRREVLLSATRDERPAGKPLGRTFSYVDTSIFEVVCGLEYAFTTPTSTRDSPYPPGHRSSRATKPPSRRGISNPTPRRAPRAPEPTEEAAQYSARHRSPDDERRPTKAPPSRAPHASQASSSREIGPQIAS